MSKLDEDQFWVVVIAASLMAASATATLLCLALQVQGWWRLLAVVPGIGCATAAALVLKRYSDL